MQSTRGAAVCAAIALIAGGLTACGEDKPVDPTTTASPVSVDTGSSTSNSSSSSSSSTSATGNVDLPKDYPAEAQKETKAGAAAFGKYYYEKMAEADHTGDTTELQQLSLGSCPPCKQAVTDINADAAKGQTRSADPNTLTDVNATKRPDKGFKVSMEVAVKAHHVYKDGEILADVKATKYTLTEHVVWSGGRWQIADWVIS